MIRRPTHEQIWKFLIVIGIGLAAGPDILAALEMRILLELLGVALFTTAFVVGAQLILWEARSRISAMLLLPAQLAVLQSEARLSIKGTAISWLMRDWPWWLSVVAIVGVCALVLIRGW